LGDSSSDLEQNEATRNSAQSISVAFCKQEFIGWADYPNAANPRQLFLDVCAKTNDSFKIKNQFGNTALAATILRLSKERIFCSCANVGDTMIAVLDGSDLTVNYLAIEIDPASFESVILVANTWISYYRIIKLFSGIGLILLTKQTNSHG
jgi:hypothetical protein